MKIDSTDASNLTLSRMQDVRPANSESKTVTKENSNISHVIENKNISQITDYEKKELPVSDKLVIDAIEKANRAISGGSRKFEFSIHEKTKQIMVKVIDAETNEIVREIPPEKTLDMVARMWEMAGIIVDERR